MAERRIGGKGGPKLGSRMTEPDLAAGPIHDAGSAARGILSAERWEDVGPAGKHPILDHAERAADANGRAPIGSGLESQRSAGDRRQSGRGRAHPAITLGHKLSQVGYGSAGSQSV